MASRTLSNREPRMQPPRNAPVVGASARDNQLITAANDHDASDVLGARVHAVLEQLIAMRFELVHGVVPRAERGTLVARDLDYMRVQLDAAVASTRGLAATCGVVPVSYVRQRDFWRSEDSVATNS